MQCGVVCLFSVTAICCVCVGIFVVVIAVRSATLVQKPSYTLK